MDVEIGFLHPTSKSYCRRPETKETLFHTRKRILKYLVLNFLQNEGCSQTAEIFKTEGHINNNYKLCDNIDLDILLQEYCSYYTLKYNKQPNILKKVDDAENNFQATYLMKKNKIEKNPDVRNIRIADAEDIVQTTYSKRRIKNEKNPDVLNNKHEKGEREEKIWDLNITQLIPIENTKSQNDSGDDTTCKKSLNDFLLLVPPKNKEMVQLVYQDILSSNIEVKWADIIGLEEAKSLLMESVIYPLKFPDLFTGLLSPWRGILLHGPPGTGKTMLARAVASESKCTFFNVSSSTIVSKWRGDSEKILKILFDMAQFYAPSIIFVDELECVAAHRDRAGEHEAARRLKAQLLVQLDGVQQNKGVFLMATSNIPWEIDPAMLRRLEKRIYTPLPDVATRAVMFQSYLCRANVSCLSTLDYEELANITEGYSGCDIRLVCKEAAMVSVRRLISSHGNRLDKSKTPPRAPTQEEVKRAVLKTKPVSKHLAHKHIQWQNKMGSE